MEAGFAATLPAGPAEAASAARPDLGLAAAWTVDLQPTGNPGSGARALMCAVLQDAIRCVMGEGRPAPQRSRLAHDARAWIIRREPGVLFSFDTVCAVLGLPPDALRARLLRAAPRIPPPRPAQRSAASHPSPTAVETLLRRGHSIRAVAQILRIKPANVSLAYGELARRVKLERNEEIRRLRRAGWTQRALAVRFGLSRMHVIRILAHAEAKTPSCDGDAPLC